jgi:hypothetical protein
LYSTKRNEFQDGNIKSIAADFKTRGLLEHCWLETLIFQLCEKTIESKINAEQDAQRWFCSTKEKQEAERKRVEAQGIAENNSTGWQVSNCSMKQQKAKELAASDNTKIIFMNGKGDSSIIFW